MENTEDKRKQWERWVELNDDIYSSVGRIDDPKQLEIISEDLARKLELKSSDTLMDVGCGTGGMLDKLSKHVNKTVGVDYSSISINIARNIFNGQFILSHANALPFQDGVFDKVICYSVFHYFFDWKYVCDTIDEIVRVTKSGGLILLGDVPSKKHIEYYSRIENSIRYHFKQRLSNLIRNLFGKKQVPTKGTVFDLRVPQPSWIAHDLDALCEYIASNGNFPKILKQPKNFQYGGITHKVRFDILVEKKE